MNNPPKLADSVEKLINENNNLNKQIEKLLQDKVNSIKQELMGHAVNIEGINFIGSVIDIDSAGAMKDMAFQMKKEVDNLVLLLGANINGKANLSLMISENLVEDKNLNASEIIKEAAKEIRGGGGGQAFFATAGGKNPEGLGAAIEKGRKLIEEKMRNG
jgi:alanyl-tRNA synthetase